MLEKRKLEFYDLSDLAPELKRLSESGYEMAGKWNLAQICEHLNHWISFPMDGFPKPGVFMSMVLWLMRHTTAKRQLQSILNNGFSNGIPTMPQTVAGPDVVDDHESSKKLISSINRFEAHQGPFHSSPLFGEMDKDTLTRLQLRHFEHHLGFLIPREN